MQNITLVQSYYNLVIKSSISHMSWKNKNKILQDEQDEKYYNQVQDSVLQEQNDPHLNADSNIQDQQDPLDAFMNDLKDQNIEKENNKKQGLQELQKQANHNCQYQELDDIGIFKNNDENQSQFFEDQVSNQYEPNTQKNRKIIEPLKPFDFSNIVLENFTKNFYEQHEDIKNMPIEVYNKLMKQHQIKVKGTNPPKLIVSFGHLRLTQKMLKTISQQGFEHPTPIQAQALPCALSGRDIVGIAKTGSGKTFAFVWPMIIHVNSRNSYKKGDGPIALVLAPTRQLCQQIYVQTKRYAKKQNIKVDCLLGGQNKHEQWKSLKAGTDILIASPGRLIQFIRKKATNLTRVTYLVLDEADRMLSLGFEQQIRSIVSQTREDRQTLLFTATMKKNMQILVGDIVTDPIRITIGDEGAANEDVKQQVIVVKQQEQKIRWLQDNISKLVSEGKILIFVNQRVQCQNLGVFIQSISHCSVLVLHGDKNQYQRTSIMNSYKADAPILVATQIAARGIDVKNIKTVINFQCPKTIQAYIHRIGRAGRAGEVGTSYTFLMQSDVKFSISLVQIFQNSGYPVPQQLQQLAMLDDAYRRKRITSKMGVSFAKGKDATKYLNNALKRQRKGYSRAGLGYDQTKKKAQQSSGIDLRLNQQAQKMKTATIQQISLMIRNKLAETKVQNKHGMEFIKSNNDQLHNKVFQPTVTYFKKKQP